MICFRRVLRVRNQAVFVREHPPARETAALPLTVQGSLVVDQQPSPPARVRDYRRGIETKGRDQFWQKLWHFNEKCPAYPTGTFAIRHDMPSDDELCSKCAWAD